MRPQKAKDFIKEVAAELGIPENIAKVVVESFWRKTRQNLSSLSHARVHIHNLGDFVVKPWSVDRAIEKEERTIKKYSDKEKIVADCSDKLSKILSVKNILEQEKQRKEFIRFHKKENKGNEEGKETKDPVEEQETDS